MPSAKSVTLSLILDDEGKPALSLLGFTPPNANSETDLLINYAVALVDAVEDGELDKHFQEIRHIMEDLVPPLADHVVPQSGGGVVNLDNIRALRGKP